jgi:hypothetical protein
MGLVVAGDVKIGARTPRLHPEWLAGAYTPLVQVIGAASRRLWQEDLGVMSGVGRNGQSGRPGPAGPTGSKGRLVKAVCQCNPPRIIRAARNTLQVAPIRCAACGGEFKLNADILKGTST